MLFIFWHSDLRNNCESG